MVFLSLFFSFQTMSDICMVRVCPSLTMWYRQSSHRYDFIRLEYMSVGVRKEDPKSAPGL